MTECRMATAFRLYRSRLHPLSNPTELSDAASAFLPLTNFLKYDMVIHTYGSDFP